MLALDGFHRVVDTYQFNLDAMTAAHGVKTAKAVVGTPREFYRQMAEEISPSAPGIEVHKAFSAMAESLRYAVGKPYYRIYPDYVDVFRRTSLKIPMKYLTAPYGAFVIRFKEGNEPTFGGRKATTMFVVRAETRELMKHVDMYDDNEVSAGARCLQITTMYAEPDKNGDYSMSTGLAWLQAEDDEQFDEYMETSKKRTSTPVEVNDARLDADFNEQTRIAVSVCFLATGGDKLIEPDVMNKDFASYLEAVNKKNAASAKALADKAVRVRNGVLGFTIGREESLLGRRTDGSRTDEAVGEGRELHYQHQRGGHFHKYWTGPNRDVLTVKWVNQLTVRPDLPLNTAPTVGAKTLRSKDVEVAILGE